MRLDKTLDTILENALDGRTLKRKECEYMLAFNETSLEASLIRSTANDMMRKKSENSAIILGQVGIDIGDCPGGCKFCAFGEGHTKMESGSLSDEDIAERVRGFTQEGDLYGLFLMTMHDYKLDRFLNAVRIAKANMPGTTQLWANVGDSDTDTFREMKKAGIDGVYHVCRIREGIDTKLDPRGRIKTMENVLEAGLSLYTCCEPIGPEHTPQEIVENMFIGIDMGCTQHAAMRRVAVKGAPLAKYGQISELRLAQIVAVVALASFTVPNMTYVGVHEPNQLAYVSGSNIVTAESGANPRDNKEDTAKGRGLDLDVCRRMLLEAGFSYIRKGNEEKIPIKY